jgi:hypothetical protein
VSDDRASTRERLNELERQRDQLEAEGVRLVQRWGAAFPRGTVPFRLVRLAGESNTLLRWRSSGGGREVRGGRFELIDARALFVALQDRVRIRVLEFEQHRIAINHDYAIAAYRVQRLRMLAAQRQALAELRRLHRDTTERGNPSTPR